MVQRIQLIPFAWPIAPTHPPLSPKTPSTFILLAAVPGACSASGSTSLVREGGKREDQDLPWCTQHWVEELCRAGARAGSPAQSCFAGDAEEAANSCAGGSRVPLRLHDVTFPGTRTDTSRPHADSDELLSKCPLRF